jgi:hypothetical protein
MTIAIGTPILVLMFVLVVGVLLFITGWRGKVINDHPICRACRFDLFGLDARDACPECGADLTRPKSRRIGQRERSRPMIAIGLLMLVLALSVGGGAAYHQLTATNWQQYKPVWWLMNEADQAPGTVSDLALVELVHRQGAGKLDQKQTQTLISKALKHQADANRQWQVGWGTFIENARANKQVTDAQWLQYATNAVADTFVLVPRSKIDHAHRIPYQVVWQGARVSGQNRAFYVTMDQIDFEINGVRFSSQGGTSGAMDATGVSTISTQVTLPKDLQLTPGKHDLNATLQIDLNEANNWAAGQPLGRTTVQRTVTFEWLPPGVPSVTVNTEPAHRQAVIDAIAVDRIRLQGYGSDKPGMQPIDIQLKIDPRPVDVAFKLYARLDGVELSDDFSSLTVAANNQTRYHMSGEVPDDWLGKKVDLILRPSLDNAQRTIDCFEIWGEEIVIPDVALPEKTE